MKRIYILTLFVIFPMLFVSCPDVGESSMVASKAGTGTLLLSINGQSIGRTIIPSTMLGDFSEFNLSFYSKDTGNTDFSRTWKNSIGMIELYTGIWDLIIIAYIENEEGVLLEAARGNYENINVSSGSSIPINIYLFPLEEGEGSFRWNISFNGSFNSAVMEIWHIGKDSNIVTLLDNEIIFIENGITQTMNLNSQVLLYAGEYRVVFVISNENEEIKISEILHIYKNMESFFENTFTAKHFTSTLLDYILAAWDDTEDKWNFIDTGIIAGHFSLIGINGIVNSNFNNIIKWFNTLCLSNTSPLKPQDIDEIKILVDAALIGMASEDVDFLDANNYEYRIDAEMALAELIMNGTDITIEWVGGDALIVFINTYEVQFIFDDDIPLPPLTGTISITGNAEVGGILVANTDNLDGSGNISYQWKRGTILIDDANKENYTVQFSDIGSSITLIVTRADNADSLVSDPTLYVTDPNLPALIGIINISGTAHVGELLTVDIDSLNGSGTISYQWRRDGKIVIGTNNNTYTVQSIDVGSIITIIVTRIDTSGSITSTPTTIVPPVLTGSVSINGNAWVGHTLTADTSALSGSGTITFQWKSGTSSIGSNSASYSIQAFDVDSTITVTVTRFGNSGNITSIPTDTIIIPPPLTGTVSITGTAIVGNTLIANTSNLNGSGAIFYQWRRGTTNIGSNSTYTVQSTDVGSTITLTVTQFNNSGSVTSTPTDVVIQLFTVSYDINGGTGIIPSKQTTKAGSNVILANGSGFSRNGFHFLGWNTNASGTGTHYSASSSFTPTDNVTLYARWSSSYATWNSSTPPIIDNNRWIAISEGASGALIIPENVIVTIVGSSSTGVVDNGTRTITLNISENAAVLWKANYRGSTINVVGTGTLQVDVEGNIYSSWGNAINSVTNSRIFINGGTVTTTFFTAINSTSTSGRVHIFDGIVSSNTVQAINAAGSFSMRDGLVIAQRTDITGTNGVVNNQPTISGTGTVVGYSLGGSHATGATTGLAFFPFTGVSVSWGLRGGWETGINCNGRFFPISGVSVSNRIVWNNENLPASITSGNIITIAEGAIGTLDVPSNVEITIISQGTEIINNRDRNISLNISSNAKVIWRANYSASVVSYNPFGSLHMGATVSVYGTGILDVNGGSIYNFATPLLGYLMAIYAPNNNTIIISGGDVYSSAQAIYTSGNITVSGGEIRSPNVAINALDSSGTITISGGVVSSVTGQAISLSDTSTFRITGGLIISQRSETIGVNGVVNRNANSWSGNGMIIYYTLGVYSEGSRTGIGWRSVTGAGLEASWGLNSGQSGINYPSGFFPVSGVTVIP